MFAYIKGSLEEKTSTYVVIDVSGVGYKIFMSANAINQIGEIGNIVKVHTHYYVREDNISLYGFLSSEELKMFELLLQVSGIGAKSAITMLSNIAPSDFALAIITNNIAALTKIPGIGQKSAQRIIIELKDKLKEEEKITKAQETERLEEENENAKDAIDALQILGYNKKEVEKALQKIELINMSTEEIIRNALKLL